MSEVLLSENKEGILTLTLNRPEKKNALNNELKTALSDALDLAMDDKNVNSVIITGKGDAFCSGQDLIEVTTEDKDKVTECLKRCSDTVSSFPKPIIAAVNGVATGAGFQLSLWCDFRIAVNNSCFAMTEINVALPCIMGSTLLMDILGNVRTRDLVLTGRFLSAQEALEWGLLNRITTEKELINEAHILAKELGEKGPICYSVNKYWINQLTKLSWEKAREYSTEATERLIQSGEPQEYIIKFLQSRKK